MTVKIEITKDEISDALRRAVGFLRRPKAMFAEIGETLLEIHGVRFQKQESPDGTPWAPLNEEYRKTKNQNADKILTLDGHLRGTLRYQADDNSVLFGSDRDYAAIHHFGGKITARNRKALNVGGRFVKSVNIPARPWLGLSRSEEERIMEIALSHLNRVISP